MSAPIGSVCPGSPAEKAGIFAGDILVSINEHDIMDVLDYRFYQYESELRICLLRGGDLKTVRVLKEEYDELGLEFETYLMDKKRSCKNKCIFCFIDQLPTGLRESLYFKDDDSRLSFLFGNYITLTNITEHEIDRIIRLHISPINISVHTTDPELRVKMMNNRFAGEALNVLKRFNSAGIQINCQLVLCPGYNDGKALEKTLEDLISLENVECVAAVPVGLTKHREGLTELQPFNADSAAETIDIIDRFGEMCIKKYGDRRIYAADEFYLLSGKDIPPASYYGDFLQLENGVGMWALFQKEAAEEMEAAKPSRQKRRISIATGEAAYPLIRATAECISKKWGNIQCEVYSIKNNFFGERITVAGLITGQDIIAQLKGKSLGKELLIPEVMLREGNDLFLDNTTIDQLESELGVKVRIVGADGASFVSAVISKKRR